MKSKEELDILAKVANAQMPNQIDASAGIDINVFKALRGAGYITAIDVSGDSGDGFISPRIEISGLQYLSELQQRKRPWWKKLGVWLWALLGVIGVAVLQKLVEIYLGELL